MRNKERLELNRKYHTNFQMIESNIPPKNNCSGHKGVCWDKRRHLWVAYISVHCKQIFLGRYSKLADAIKARQKAEDEYFLPLIEQKASEEVSDD